VTAVTESQPRKPALLVTADGAVFAGEAAGAAVRVATGELVFNTAMSGYQEVITDPSYAGQVISFTSTHIGNYGTNAADDEALVPHCRGVVVCDLADVPSNWRATEGLEPFLPVTCASPAPCLAHSGPRPSASCGRRPRPPRGPTGWTW